MLIVARAFQGLGAAIVSPAALSIVTNTFKEGAERNKALGVWGAVAGSGGAAGVLLGGVLTEYLGWEWVLFVNTPITLIAAFLAPRILDESLDRQAGTFDVPGAVSVTAGLSILVYALVDAESAGWGSTQTIGLLALALALLVAFVAIESRTEKPLMPLSVFKLQTLRGSNVAGLLIGMSLFSMFFFISLYLQQVLGYEPLKAGFAYLPLALTIIVSAGVASQLVTKIGFKPVLVTGPAVRGGGHLLVLERLGAWRHVRGRRAVPVAAGGDRAGLLVRHLDHRSRDRGPPQRGRIGLGPDQHIAAGGRRTGPGDHRRGRHRHHERRVRVR